MDESSSHWLHEREVPHWFRTTRRDIIREVLQIGNGTDGKIGPRRSFGTLPCIESSELGRPLTAPVVHVALRRVFLTKVPLVRRATLPRSPSLIAVRRAASRGE